MQGPGTDEAPLAELRKATRLGKACVVQLVNYRRNGDAFVNYLSVTPIHNEAGILTHYVGIQSDITDLVNHKKAELAAKHAAVQVGGPAVELGRICCFTCPDISQISSLATRGLLHNLCQGYI